MKKTYFHGTSADNLQSIIENGLSCYESKIWSCSENAIYLWNGEKVAVEQHGYDLEELDQDQAFEAGFDMATESAQCALAVAIDCRMVVVVVEIDEDEVEVDCSCENMEVANCVYRDILPSEIKEIRVSNDFSLLRGYFINRMVGREYSALYFTPMETKVAAAFSSAEIYPEDLGDMMEWETVLLSEPA